MTCISALDVTDVRFPTSLDLDGSDAMNPEPDYSAAYVVLRTDDPGVVGCSLLFTTGRGNDVACAAVRALAPYVVGRDVGELVSDVGALARTLTWDGQLRWLGPEKGVMHMAIGAVVNAAWDLRARLDGQPLWRVLASLRPEEIVRQIDFSYIDDALTPDEALALLEASVDGRAARTAALEARGLPAYTTSAGWLGYDDAKVARLVHTSVAEGFTMLKLKVGGDVESDVRRLQVARVAAGEGAHIALDANQRWGVGQAIDWLGRLAAFEPYWIEEPTSPDDVLGHRAIRDAVHPIRVATGEHVQAVALAELVANDPFAVTEADVAAVEARASVSGSRHAASQAATARLDVDLAHARDTLAALDAGVQAAAGELEHAAGRVVGVQRTAPVPDLAALGTWLERIADTATTDRPRAAADLAAWSAAAQARHDELDAALAPARAGLRRRDEGRGLWTALRAKAAAHRRDEQPDVAEALSAARDQLWSAPCDLDVAEAALARLSELLSGGADKSRLSSPAEPASRSSAAVSPGLHRRAQPPTNRPKEDR